MRTFTTIVGFFLAACLSEGYEADLNRLNSYLIGTYSNSDQARGDRNFRDVTLHIVEIWTDRTDGPWLYLEQALSDAPDHPYRQLVYQLLSRVDGSFELKVFEPPSPIALTGAWKDPSGFGKFSPSELIAREGCSVIYRVLADGSFEGATFGNGCASTLRGAKYSTTESRVSERQMISWDRGFNTNGAQVWGSVHGGYIFRKVE